MLAPEAERLALLVLGAAYGATSTTWLPQSDLFGVSLKTPQGQHDSGLMLSEEIWESLAMQRFRSTLRRVGSGLPTCAPESSLLPTLTASRYGSSNNGDPGDGRGSYATAGKPSLDKLAGGNLSLEWATWMMGFPQGWLQSSAGP